MRRKDPPIFYAKVGATPQHTVRVRTGISKQVERPSYRAISTEHVQTAGLRSIYTDDRIFLCSVRSL